MTHNEAEKSRNYALNSAQGSVDLAVITETRLLQTKHTDM